MAANRPVWKRRPFVYGAVAVALLAGNWIFDRLSRPRAGGERVTPFTDTAGSETCAAWSPDGGRVAFVWRGEESEARNRLYVKPAAGGPAVALTGGEGEEWSPAWSPGGGEIAYSRVDGGHGGYYLVPASGGAGRVLAEFGAVPGDERVPPALCWMPDGRRLAAAWKDGDQSTGIFLLGLDGRRTRLTTAPAGSPGDGAPAVSPDGRSVAFVRRSAGDAGDIYLVPASGGEPRRLTFDGKAVAGLAWAPDGREIVFASARLGEFRLWRVGAGGGTPRELASTSEGARYPAVSPTGRLLFTRTAPDANIWRVDLSDPEHPERRFIASPRREWAAQYSPDGRRVAFLSDRSGSDQVWVCDSEGNHPVQLTTFNLLMAEPRWSPDGRQIVFSSRGVQTAVYVAPSGGGAARKLPIPNVAFAASASWSRDGRSIYFFGEDRIWKAPAAGGRATAVTRRPGFAPLEAPDGKSIYYHWIGRVWQAGGGREGEPISDFLRPMDAQFWALGKGGIYFVEWQRRERDYPLRFYDLEKQEGREVCILSHLRRGDPTFAISPDERYALYSKGEETTDLMVTALK